METVYCPNCGTAVEATASSGDDKRGATYAGLGFGELASDVFSLFTKHVGSGKPGVMIFKCPKCNERVIRVAGVTASIRS